MEWKHNFAASEDHLTGRIAAKFGLLVGFMLLLSACTTTSAPPPPLDDEPPEFTDEYRIGVGDQLRVIVWRHDDLSISAPVRPDGRITVPISGDIMVGGMTPESVGDTIAEALGDYIRDPVVTVSVVGMGSSEYLSRVRVTGAVGSPSSVPYRPGMTVLDVVLDAGGVTEFANAAGTTVYRRTGETMKIRLDRILKHGDLSTNFPVRSGDVITVPERLF